MSNGIRLTRLPFTGFYIKAAHRWFMALDIADALDEFAAWRDENGFGASDIGGRFPLYRMSASGTSTIQIGTVGYNASVTYRDGAALPALATVQP